MRIVIDEDIPNELTPLFRGPGLVVQHVEDIGHKGKKNGLLLAALSSTYDILVTGDTNLGASAESSQLRPRYRADPPASARRGADQATDPASGRCLSDRSEACGHDDRGPEGSGTEGVPIHLTMQQPGAPESGLKRCQRPRTSIGQRPTDRGRSGRLADPLDGS